MRSTASASSAELLVRQYGLHWPEITEFGGDGVNPVPQTHGSSMPGSPTRFHGWVNRGLQRPGRGAVGC